MKAQEYQLLIGYLLNRSDILLLNASVTSSNVQSTALSSTTLPFLPLLLNLLQGEQPQLLAHSQGHQLQNIFSYLSSRQSANGKPEAQFLLPRA